MVSKEGRFQLDTKKKNFTMRVVSYCSKLCRELVDALKTFKVRLDEVLRNQT